MPAFSIAVVTRELWPFVTGGGIGRTVHGTIRLLASEAEVTVITRQAFREEYERLRTADDPRLPHPDTRFEFIPDPEGFELGPYTSYQHCWSARVYERLCELYPNGGPDLVEFSDYLGEGFVTTQARQSGHPSLSNTRVLVRLHTSLEMVDAINGTRESEELRAIYTLERGSIALADHILSPAAAVLSAYQRFYGANAVAPGMYVPNVIALPASGEPAREPPPGARIRLLFVGRLQRVKGVEELVQAVTRLGRDDWELTLLGGDTDTASVGGSMRAHLDRLAGGHQRIHFHEPVSHERVLRMMDEHHVVLVPSLWECWPNVSREALMRNRPVLATPVGALPDAAVAGVSGWVTEGTSSEDIERGLRTVLDSREEIEAMIASGGPERHLRSLMVPDATLEHYRRFATREEPMPRAPQNETVSAVIVCSARAGSLQVTLDSLARQQLQADEVVLVCDGVGRLPAGFGLSPVDSLQLLPPGVGPHACRNAGLESAKGELLLLVDAGTELHPLLVEGLAAALRKNPDAGYATAWAHGLDPGAVPFGNFANLVPEYENAAVTPLLRRRVLERGHRFDPSLGSCAGRAFYAALADDGLFGCVVPERLVSQAPFSAACADSALLNRIAHGAARSARQDPAAWVVP
jgi:glycogen synthase